MSHDRLVPALAADASSPADLMRTRSPLMARVLGAVESVAPTRSTVLLTGETGTGKGLVARALHALSDRRDRPFLAVHCGAIAESLLESELFGHERGAFTGAARRKQGKFELAQGGTLFLDELGTIGPSAQVKLLQVLQDRVIQRVGGEDDIHIDVRLIAATNSDLRRMVQDNLFRSDLYYRLSVFPIELPPLRERREDLPLLCDTILHRLNQAHGKTIEGFHTDVLAALDAYPWPGNIRELENLLERAHILERTSLLTPESFPAELFAIEGSVAPVAFDTSRTLAEVRRAAVEAVERRYLLELLAENAGRIAATASAAGITARQLHKLLTRHGIDKDDFKRNRTG